MTYNNVEESNNGKMGRKKSDVAIMGAPFDLASEYGTGQRKAPYTIREAGTWEDNMFSDQHNVDPMQALEVVDVGDVEVIPGDTDGGWKAIKDMAANVYSNTKCLITLGGDHTVSAKVIAGIVSVERDPITVFHFDAHHDYWKHDKNVEMNHGSWVRWVIDNGLANRVVQFGVRGWGISPQEIAWASKNDVITYHASSRWMDMLAEELRDTSDPIYLSIDIDVLDPAFAPGVVSPEPGGLTTRELFSAIRTIAASGKMIGADLVEVVPDRDFTGITSKVANRCIAQLLTGLSIRQ